MNQKEYELIAETFMNHRKRYGNRTDAVALEIIADFTMMLQNNYSNFDKVKFYSSMNLTIGEIANIERNIY